MTGLIGLAKIFAIAALGASGLLAAGTQFDAVGPAAVSSETSAGIENGGQTSTWIDADAPAPSGITFECLDNCPAPCATACADLQMPPLEGAEEAAALGAADAPEPPALAQVPMQTSP